MKPTVFLQVIKEELFRNMGLALLAVFIVTLIVLANLWTCLLVFTCVGFTLVSGQWFLTLGMRLCDLEQCYSYAAITAVKRKNPPPLPVLATSNIARV